MNHPIFSLLMAVVLASVASQPLPAEQADPAAQEDLAHNPLIWADVPDICVIRVGKTYYMSSTTMKDGDWAGIAAFQRQYGFVGVKMSDGVKSLVMVSADSDQPEEIASVPFSGDTVHLKVECEFEPSPEFARFSYSLDGRSWTPLGRPSALAYTIPHFMGYRYALFFYSTQTAGGRVDFDYYRIGQSDDRQTHFTNNE